MNTAPLLLCAVLTVSIAPTAIGADDLLDLFRLAARADATLQGARADLNAARASGPIARAARQPQAMLSGTGTFVVSDSETDNTGRHQYSVQLTQPLYDNRLDANVQIADATASQAQAEYDASEQTLILRVAQAYFDVLAAQDTLVFTNTDKAAIERQLEQSQKRYEVGLIAITDVHEAQARFDLVAAAQITAQNTVDSARAALQVIIATRPNTLKTVSDRLPLAPPDPVGLDAWIKRAKTDNLSLIAATENTRRARANIRAQDFGNDPTVNLVVAHSHGQTFGGRSGSSTDNTVGVQLNWPLYTGGGTAARVRQAEHQFAAALAAAEQTHRSVMQQTSDAYRGVLAGISRVKALRQAVISNTSALEATEAGFDVGTRTIVDVLNAERNLGSAIRDFKRARYDYVLATLSLKQAAGNLAVSDLATINGWLD